MKNASSRNLIHTALLAVFMCVLPAVAGEDVYGLGSGRDGPLSLGSGTTTVNLYARISAQALAGTNSVTIASNPGIGGGALVMLLQTTGISPEPPSGGPDSIDLSSSPVGRWELARVNSLAGNTLILDAPLLNTYAATGAQVILVREYTTVTLGSGGLVPGNWNGSTGGVLAFLATGNVHIDGSLTATSRGFRGGQVVRDSSGTNICTGVDEPAPRGAQKGEGIAMSRYGTSHTGFGRVANGAGGGVCLKSGGGGGGSSGAGGRGGFSEAGNPNVRGQGGASLSFSPVSRLLLGGGGAPGHVTGGSSAAGGQGGGIVFIRGGSLSGTGTLIADGFLSSNVSTGDAAGGGGGGGTLYLRFSGTAFCNPSRVHAWGGIGGNTNAISGPGGGGGGGRILFQACGGGNCLLPGSAVAGGASGTSSATFDSYGAEPGADGLLTIFAGCYAPLPVPVVVTPAHNSSTNDATPIYTGTLMPTFPPGTDVIVYVDGSEVGRVTPDAAGNWSFTQPTNLPEGPHTVYAVAINLSQGLQSAPSNTSTFRVDTTSPAAPMVRTPDANSIINDNTPTYSGIAELGSTLTVIVDGTIVGTTTVDATGNWSLAQPTSLTDGAHTVQARATDIAGNTSPDSNTHVFFVDTTPPTAPVLLTPVANSIINDNTPTYSGIAEPLSTVTVIVDGTIVGTTTVDTTMSWTLVQPTPLADNAHTVRARAMDVVGNISMDSDTHAFAVDTTPPEAPVILSPGTGSITHDNTPTYSGTAEPLSTIMVVVDGMSMETTTADATGSWNCGQPTPLVDGSHVVSARAMDAAGNTSPESNTNTFRVDTTLPAAPVLVAPPNGLITTNNRLTYSGTAEPGSTVTLLLSGQIAGTTIVGSSGDWSLTPGDALTDGLHTVQARATDAAGHLGPSSEEHRFTVDTMPPGAPEVREPQGSFITQTPVIGGTAEPSSRVTVSLDKVVVATVMADEMGGWSLTSATKLELGRHVVSAIATDEAGNDSPPSADHSFVVQRSHYGWGCITTPALPTLWILLALALSLSRRWLRLPR